MAICGKLCVNDFAMYRGGVSGNPVRFSSGTSLSSVYTNYVAPMRLAGGAVGLARGRNIGFYRFNGSSFEPMLDRLLPPNTVFGMSSLVPLDLNDDGLSDVWWQTRRNAVGHGGVYLYMALENGSFVDSTRARFGEVDAEYPQSNYCGWGDLNGDTRIDVVTTEDSFNYARVHLQQPNGTFVRNVEAGDSLGQASIFTVAVVEVTGDNLGDIITSSLNRVPFNTQLYVGLPNGTYLERFEPLITAPGSDIFWFDYELFDSNGDGLTDIAFSGWLRGPDIAVAGILFSKVDGGFGSNASFLPSGNGVLTSGVVGSSRLLFSAGSRLTRGATVGFRAILVSGTTANDITNSFFPEVASETDLFHATASLADYTNDGCTDLIVCGRDEEQRALSSFCASMVGDCTGVFTPGQFLLPDCAPATLTWRDFDGDGLDDLFYTCSTDYGSTNMFQLRLTTLGIDVDVSGTHLPGSGGIWEPWAAVDYDGDGAIDLTSVGDYRDSSHVLFWRNLGNGTFVNVSSPIVGYTPVVYDTQATLAWGDLDQTGRMSVFMATGRTAGMACRNYGNGSIIADPFLLPGVGMVWEDTTIIADFDQDGFSDVASLGGTTFVAFGRGGWNMTAPVLNAFDQILSDSNCRRPWSTLMWLADGRPAFLVGSVDLPVAGRTFHPPIIALTSNRTVEDLGPAMLPSDAGRSHGTPDATNDTIVFVGKGTGSCSAPAVLVPERQPPALSSSGGGASSSTADDADTPLAAIFGAAAGGVVLLALASAAVCAVVLCCVAILCVVACVVFFLVAIVAVAGLAVLSVGGVGVVGAAAGGAGFAMSRRKVDVYVVEDVVEDMDEVIRRMRNTKEYRHIAYDELRFGRKIGEGAFGAVYAGEWAGVKVAIKVLKSEAVSGVRREFENEALTMAKVSHHPNILTFVGAVVEHEYLCLVTHFAEGGSLDAALEAGKVRPGDRARLATECAAGLAFLHEQGVVHRDVAARNVLIDGSGRAQLADFGCSRILENGADEQSTKSSVGPIRWMAPESISARVYSSASDAYMFGMLLFEIYHSGETPFINLTSLADVAIAVTRENKRPLIAPNVPEHVAQLIRMLWSHDPADRPSMASVYDHFAACDASDDTETTGERTILSVPSMYEAFHE